MSSCLKQVRNTLSAIFSIALLIINTTLCFIPIFIIGMAKLLPIEPWQIRCMKAVDKIVAFWIMFNNAYLNQTQSLEWQIEGMEHVTANNWYLVIANHQSWLDIVVLQRIFNRRIPVLKFFMKSQLRWIPVLGFCWWAMGCPFMKRYSSSYLKKHPHKKGKDLLTTQKACKNFNKVPVSITNFIEGSRFSAEKKLTQQSPYKHLLKPKAGGIAFVLNAMDQKVNTLIDVTIIYPQGRNSLWDFLCHRVNKIRVHINTVNVPSKFIQANYGNLLTEEFKQWVNEYWQQKDQLIETLSSERTPCPR